MVSDILMGRLSSFSNFLKFKVKYCGVVKGKHQGEKEVLSLFILRYCQIWALTPCCYKAEKLSAFLFLKMGCKNSNVGCCGDCLIDTSRKFLIHRKMEKDMRCILLLLTLCVATIN